MPMVTSKGTLRKSELPGTIRRSTKGAQETFAKAHDAAAEQYGDGERAHRTAYAALKHSYEKVGDHWERKEKGRRGPSDRQAAGGKDTDYPTAGGVDTNASKQHLYELAKKLDIKGRSTMTKRQLVNALKKASS